MRPRDCFDVGVRIIGLLYFLNYASQWWIGALGWLVMPSNMPADATSFRECVLYGIITTLIALIIVFRADILTNAVYGSEPELLLVPTESPASLAEAVAPRN